MKFETVYCYARLTVHSVEETYALYFDRAT